MGSGTTVDSELGGCKCADPNAEWLTGTAEKNGPPAIKSKKVSACFCTDGLYPSYPVEEAATKGAAASGTGWAKGQVSTANRLKCGVIVECLQAAVRAEMKKWNTGKWRAGKVLAKAKKTARRQAGAHEKASELLKAARAKAAATKLNRKATRAQLASINDSYMLARLRSGLSAEEKTRMRANFAQQVAQVRLRWNTRKAQAAEDYEQVRARQETAANFVAEDTWFAQQAHDAKIDALEKEHLTTIRNLQKTPIVVNVYKKFATVSGDKLDSAGTPVKQTKDNCPLIKQY